MRDEGNWNVNEFFHVSLLLMLNSPSSPISRTSSSVSSTTDVFASTFSSFTTTVASGSTSSTSGDCTTGIVCHSVSKEQVCTQAATGQRPGQTKSCSGCRKGFVFPLQQSYLLNGMSSTNDFFVYTNLFGSSRMIWAVSRKTTDSKLWINSFLFQLF